MRRAVDPSFLALPLEPLAHAALTRAGELGARDASFRILRTRTGRLRLRDGVVEAASDSVDIGLGVRLVYDGTWGYAAAAELTTEAAAGAARQAVEVAIACRPLRRAPVTLAEEATCPRTSWVSPYDIDPFDVPETERAALLAGWSHRLLNSSAVEHVLALFTAVRENRFYADAAGAAVIQQRVRVHPMVTAFGRAVGGEPASLRTAGPPTGRGWEYLGGAGWDFDAELAELPEQLAAKSRARPVRPGSYDLVIDASNLWLTIHETVGHATELDRALGHEASYAGTTFVTPDGPGTLRFGAPLMNVTADRTTEHGLATIGVDDEGVAAQSWELVRDGVLIGLQTDRRTAALAGASRSTGCSFAESAEYPPLARMPNVCLRPAAGGPDVAGLISGVEDGIYLAGANSWSIDPRREHFQFTAQRCHRIRSGRLDGQLSGVAYQGETTGFWGGLAALGGPATYGLFGADLCGKGQPVQVAAASHGCPAAVFSGVRVERVGGERRS
ncbi:MAG TPA: TldD/PmbA family protein [Jatrophihabitans sp.]|jgi:TldD protein|uniref:TldD/PmbA family protein n=1 Tax=Jatrophihabitans sp. TaxID=1932789 RepID=UPI002F1DA428